MALVRNSRSLRTVATFIVQTCRDRGKFPKTAQNGSSQVAVDQIYTSPSSPFDQRE